MTGLEPTLVETAKETGEQAGEGVQRIAIGVEYDGSGFSGWQRQHHSLTVQQVVEEALSAVADQEVRVQCAGRTDTGVHGRGQVAHFDVPIALSNRRPPRAWRLGANANLPETVALQWVRPVPNDFHARFSATGRHYRYLILQRDSRSPLWHNRATWTHRPLAIAPMREAAQHLVGRHDFTSFRALACQAKSPVRELRYLEVERQGELIELRLGADGFLHHMVHNIAGVLMAIGRGEASTDWTRELLALRDRAQGAVTAPPQGLYLERIDYPERFGLIFSN